MPRLLSFFLLAAALCFPTKLASAGAPDPEQAAFAKQCHEKLGPILDDARAFVKALKLPVTEQDVFESLAVYDGKGHRVMIARVLAPGAWSKTFKVTPAHATDLPKVEQAIKDFFATTHTKATMTNDGKSLAIVLPSLPADIAKSLEDKWQAKFVETEKAYAGAKADLRADTTLRFQGKGVPPWWASTQKAYHLDTSTPDLEDPLTRLDTQTRARLANEQ